MVFSSHVPFYLDPPNWQQANQQPGVSIDNPQLPSLPPPPQVGGRGSGDSGGTGSIRPGSMTDRAGRLAKIPQPEAALKCPRCESTNTKFCYFNNYSQSQPRHFCKTCRRYWTRGGALRNVPVGGGCRRNKRSKGSSSSSNRSKSPMVVTERQATAGSKSSNSTCTSHDIKIGNNGMPPPAPQQIPILPSLHHLSNYNSADFGLNFGGIHGPLVAGGGSDMEFQIVTPSGGGGGPSMLSNGFVEQWRLQQFPFLEPATGLYPFEGEGEVEANKQLDSVKMEENHQGLNLPRNFLGNISGNDQYWGGGNAWTEQLPSFTSSNSTSHLL